MCMSRSIQLWMSYGHNASITVITINNTARLKTISHQPMFSLHHVLVDRLNWSVTFTILRCFISSALEMFFLNIFFKSYFVCCSMSRDFSAVIPNTINIITHCRLVQEWGYNRRVLITIVESLTVMNIFLFQILPPLSRHYCSLVWLPYNKL
jgi:hypothetical protein